MNFPLAAGPQSCEQRPLDARKRMTVSTRFDLKFFHVLSINRHPGILHCTFFTRKVSNVIVMEGG